MNRIDAIRRLRTLPTSVEVVTDGTTGKMVVVANVAIGLKEAKDLVEEIMAIEPIQVTMDKELLAQLRKELSWAKEDYDGLLKKYNALCKSIQEALNLQ